MVFGREVEQRLAAMQDRLQPQPRVAAQDKLPPQPRAAALHPLKVHLVGEHRPEEVREQMRLLQPSAAQQDGAAAVAACS